MHPRLICLIALACLSAAAVPAFAADPPPPADYKVGDKLAAPTPSATPGGDLRRELECAGAQGLGPDEGLPRPEAGPVKDGDPRAQEMMARMRQAMQSAPTVPALDGQRVRIAGFLVPLESNGDKLRGVPAGALLRRLHPTRRRRRPTRSSTWCWRSRCRACA